MKNNVLTNVVVWNRAGSSFFQKLFVASLIFALLVTSLPAHAALAAPAGDGTTVETKNFEQAWSNKMDKVRYNSIFYERVRVYPADFEDLDELAIAHDILNNYGVALRAAQRIVLNHSGFDQKGRVTNANLADQSLKDLSEYLRQMRVLKARLNDLKGEYRLLPAGAVTTTS